MTAAFRVPSCFWLRVVVGCLRSFPVPPMDVLIRSPFPETAAVPRFLRARTFRPTMVSIQPPPPGFDFRETVLPGSRDTIARTHPELLDLAEDGTLLLVKKRQFGPVPSWRTEFVEPQEIWLVGTSHISEDSAGDVERVVRALSPENVVVELCRSRAGIMYTTNNGQPDKQLRSSMFSLSGSEFFGAVGRSINLGGQAALALRLLLAVFSSKISTNINRRFGNEFRAARRASEEVGAQIVLGDRPIEITLQRAWRCLTWDQKMGLVTSVFRGITSQGEIYSKEIQDQESSSSASSYQLYEQLSFSYPALLQPLLHERDTYLAWSLKRSKAVNNSRRVVGVIGKGHMNGVVYALVSDQGNLRFRDLAGKAPGESRPQVWVENLMRSLVKDTIIGILLWALYELVKGFFFF